MSAIKIYYEGHSFTHIRKGKLTVTRCELRVAGLKEIVGVPKEKPVCAKCVRATPRAQ